MAPADGLSPLQVCVPWEEDVTFPVEEEQERGPEGLKRLRRGLPVTPGLCRPGPFQGKARQPTKDLPA